MAPWKARDANRTGGSPTLLILDAYCVHQMGSVVNRIQLMGVEVVISLRAAHTCVNPLILGSINLSKANYERNGSSG
jgi:hypothetical protein